MSPPSPFVAEWLPRAAARLTAALRADPRSRHAAPTLRAIDLAMGGGRHVALLAAAGFRPFGVDRSLDAVRGAVAAARAAGVGLCAFCADLTEHPLPAGRFDLALVTRYLDRDRMPAIRETVRPGGLVLYETFTRDQLSLGWGPTSPAHLLAAGELAAHFRGFDLLFYEETSRPEALARLVARRPD